MTDEGKLKYFGVPWLTIKDPVPYIRPLNSTSRMSERSSETIRNYDPQLPFLGQTDVPFETDEIEIIKEIALSSSHTSRPLAKIPSRLQQIRQSHQDLVGAVSSERITSSEYTLKKQFSRKLEKDDSIISLKNFEDEIDVAKADPLPKSDNATDADIVRSVFPDFEKEMTAAEIPHQIWNYCHERNTARPSDSKQLTFNTYQGEIPGSKTLHHISRGRKRLLKAINDVAENAERIDEDKAEPPLLTDNSFCAKKTKEYFDKNFLWQPPFFEKPIPQHETRYIQKHCP